MVCTCIEIFERIFVDIDSLNLHQGQRFLLVKLEWTHSFYHVEGGNENHNQVTSFARFPVQRELLLVPFQVPRHILPGVLGLGQRLHIDTDRNMVRTEFI